MIETNLINDRCFHTKFDEPGLSSAPKSTNVYRRPNMSTSAKSDRAAWSGPYEKSVRISAVWGLVFRVYNLGCRVKG